MWRMPHIPPNSGSYKLIYARSAFAASCGIQPDIAAWHRPARASCSATAVCDQLLFFLGWILLMTTKLWKPLGSSKLIIHIRRDFFAPVDNTGHSQPVAEVYLHVQISPISAMLLGRSCFCLKKNTGTAIVGYQWMGVGGTTPCTVNWCKKRPECLISFELLYGLSEFRCQ